MESQYNRSIKDGRAYDHLFPTPHGKHITILKDAEVDDTISLIQRSVPLTLNDTKKIAQILEGKSLEETCGNIWHFVYDHIQYKRDEKGIEQVRRPARTWWERRSGVDCDCYTEFISSILTNLGIAHKLRITKYNGKAYFQHIYPIVPKDGNINKPQTNREDYITMDCVKDAFDDEQTFSAFKDYDMRLDYLNGLDDYRSPENTDIGDLSSMVDDNELNGKVNKWLKSAGGAVKKGVRFLNRNTNPGTIMLRNGFLLAMKTNLMRIAERLRYAYLSEAKAKAMGMDMNAFAKLKKVMEKAETIYYQAGGKKENLKKAILSGKGNKDKKVPLNGVDDEYSDQQEYDIINGVDGFGDLGEPVTAASIASATAVLTAISAALSQVKGLFKANTPAAKQFNQASASTNTSSANNTTDSSSEEDNSSNEENAVQTTPASDRTAVPAKSSAGRNASGSNQALVPSSDEGSDSPGEGFLSKASNWVKQNPGKSLLVAGAIIGAGFMLFKKNTPAPTRSGLSGTPSRKKKKRKKTFTKKQKTKKPIRTVQL